MFFDESILISAKKIDHLGGMLKDFRTPLKRSLRQVIIPSIQMNFDKGGRPRWAPLADDTVKRKGGNARPLMRSGALRAGMGDISVWDIGRERAVLSDLPESIWYGKVHQNGAAGGGAGGSGNTAQVKNVGTKGYSGGGRYKYGGAGGGTARADIPARPFIQIQDSDLPLIDAIFSEWLQEQIVKAGLG
jgi:phage gpG-like protein